MTGSACETILGPLDICCGASSLLALEADNNYGSEITLNTDSVPGPR